MNDHEFPIIAGKYLIWLDKRLNGGTFQYFEEVKLLIGH